MRRNRDQHADIMFIRSKYEELAAIAWRGYQKSGRGFLLITSGHESAFPCTKEIAAKHTGVLTGRTRVQYVPVQALESTGAEYPSEAVEEMVNKYDSKWEIVVVVERESGSGWGTYRYVGHIKPATAFKKWSDKLAPVASYA